MFEDFRKKRAIKQYLKKLPSELRKRYGMPEKYTEGQLRTTVENLGLNQKHIEFAYLMFCGEELLLQQGEDQEHIENLIDFLTQKSIGVGSGDAGASMFDSGGFGGGFGDGGGGGDA